MTLFVCAILGVLVSCADLPAAEHYRPAIEALPAGHWQVVRELVMLPPGATGKYNNRRIRLPADGSERVLYHEVGHAVGDYYQLGTGDNTPSAVDSYCAARKLGKQPSRYARTSCRESFAEVYRAILMGESEQRWQRRANLIRRLVPNMPERHTSGRFDWR